MKCKILDKKYRKAVKFYISIFSFVFIYDNCLQQIYNQYILAKIQNDFGFFPNANKTDKNNLNPLCNSGNSSSKSPSRNASTNDPYKDLQAKVDARYASVRMYFDLMFFGAVMLCSPVWAGLSDTFGRKISIFTPILFRSLGYIAITCAVWLDLALWTHFCWNLCLALGGGGQTLYLGVYASLSDITDGALLTFVISLVDWIGGITSFIGDPIVGYWIAGYKFQVATTFFTVLLTTVLVSFVGILPETLGKNKYFHDEKEVVRAPSFTDHVDADLIDGARSEHCENTLGDVESDTKLLDSHKNSHKEWLAKLKTTLKNIKQLLVEDAKRSVLIILLITIYFLDVLGSNYNEEIQISYLFGTPFCFDSISNGIFKTASDALDMICGFALLFLMYLKIGSDFFYLMSSLVNGMARPVLLGLGCLFGRSTSRVFIYLSLLSLYDVTQSVSRSALCKIVSPNQTGIALSLVAFIDAFSSVLTPLTYPTIYKVTLHWFPGFAFILGGILITIAILLTVMYASYLRMFRNQLKIYPHAEDDEIDGLDDVIKVLKSSD